MATAKQSGAGRVSFVRPQTREEKQIVRGQYRLMRKQGYGREELMARRRFSADMVRNYNQSIRQAKREGQAVGRIRALERSRETFRGQLRLARALANRLT